MLAVVLMVVAGQETLEELFTAQQGTASELYAASAAASTFGTVQYGVGGGWGFKDVRSTGKSDAMQLDTAARIGSVMDIVVVAAALTIPAISDNLNKQVPAGYIPNGPLNLINPAAKSSPITYQMLMQHTSTLTDDLYYSAELSTSVTCTTQCTGGSTTTFDQFMKATFTAVSATSTDLTSSIFTTQTPGQAASYLYAHINTALLIYIMDQLVSDGTVTVQSTEKTAASWIYETVLQPLGMSSTFYLLLNGEIPQTGNQAMSAILNSMVLDFDSGNNQQWMTHPNIHGDVMGYSTVQDLQKLANKLLAETSACTTQLCTAGALMREKKIAVTNGRLFQNGMGLGVMFYSPEEICSATTATATFSKCPLTTASNVWGHVSGGTRTDLTAIAGVVCTDASGSNDAIASCVSVVQGKKTGSPLDATTAFEMIGGAFQLSFGETTVVSTSGNSSSDDLYGLWVILGVAGTVVFVLAASYFTEFLIQPPPPVGPGPFRPPQQQQPMPDKFQPPPPQF